MGMMFSCKSLSSANGNEAVSSASQNNMPAGLLNEVSYSYQGMRMEMVGSPTLKRTDSGKALLTFRFYADERSYEVSDTLLDKARGIIEEAKMYEYEPSYSPSFEGRILDGYSWSFSATFEGGGRLYSHGSNASPKGDGLHRIEKLFQDAARQCLIDAGDMPAPAHE